MRDMEARTALVDLAHISRTFWHSSEGQPLSSMLDKSLDALWKVKGAGFSSLICAIDSPPYERREVYPEYKANRDNPGPVYFEQYKLLQEKAQGLGFKIASSKGYEADDVIATLARGLSGEVLVYTNDKDLLQLVSARVKVVSTGDFSIRTVDAVIEKFGVSPSLVGDWLALVGDASDNIPGCPKIGAKTATKIIAGTGGLASLWSIIDEGLLPIGCTAALVEALKANREQIKVSRELIRLRDDVPVSYAAEPKKVDIEMEVNEEVSHEAEQVVTVVASKQATKEVAYPAIAKTTSGMIDSIELRPGVFLTSAKYDLMKHLAKNFFEGGLYSRKFQNAQAVFTVMMLGVELGVSPQIACQNFHIIEGKPCPSAHFLIAMAKRDRDCIYLEMESESDSAVTYVTKKKSYPKELRFSYSMEDAVRDRMKWSSGKEKNTRAMLRKTAGSQAARLWYPEACNGLYSMEEMGFNAEEEEER